jgi:DNA-binding Lrp family transcriptional regulator
VDAYVYLRVAPGKIDDVVIALRGGRGVRRAVSVVGTWDVMVAAEGADFRAIAKTVLQLIQPIDGVLRTYTTPIVPLELLGIQGGGWAIPTPMHREEGEACYVHIRAAAGSVAGIVETLGELEAISGVAVVAGEYDVLAEIPLPWEEAAPVVLDRIQTIPGVLMTSTSVAAPAISELADEEDQYASWA